MIMNPKINDTCFCCKKVKENGTYIDDRYVCQECNHLEDKEKRDETK